MDRKRRWKTCLLFVLLTGLLTGTALAAAPVQCLTPTYAAETVLFGEAVCPTLLPGDGDGTVVVRWIARHGDPVAVHWGPDDGSGALPAEHSEILAESEVSKTFSANYRTHLFRAELTLSPGDYLYGLAPEGEEPETLYPIHWRTEEGFRVVMSSDSHISNGKQTRIYEEAVLAAAGERGADLVFHAGDLSENTKSDPYTMTNTAPHTRSVPTAIVAGNHDRSGTIYRYFAMPNMDKKTGDYWFIQGNILFVGLNIGYKDYHAHAEYVRRTVPAHREGCDWVVAAIHYSMESNGSHGHDRPVALFRMNLAPAFAETDVDLVISGHDHEYDRSYLLDAEGMVEDSGGEAVEKKEGETLYVSLPTAVGTKFYKRVTVPLYPLAAEAQKFERGYVTADFTPDALELTAWNAETGAVEDHVILTKAA